MIDKTKSKSRLLILVVCALGILAGPAVLHAQDSTPKDKESKDLVHSAAFIKKRLNELLVAMSDVATLLEKTEPEVAKILRRAVDYAQSEDVSDKLEDVINALRGGLDEAAQVSHSEVIADLTTMLRIIEGGVNEDSDMDKRIAELRAVRNRLDKTIKKQTVEEKKTRPAANEKDIDDQTKKLIEYLENIVKQQQELMGKTGKLKPATPDVKNLSELRNTIRELIKQQEKISKASDTSALAKIPVLGEAQAKLSKKTQAAIKAIKKSNIDPKTRDKTAAFTKDAADEMTHAAKSLSESNPNSASPSQKRAMERLKAAEKKLSEAIAKKTAGQPSSELSQKQGKLAEQTDGLKDELKNIADKAGMETKKTGDLGKAAKCMKKAEDKLSSQESSPAVKQQEMALKELKRAVDDAKKLRRLAAEKAKTKVPAEPQNEIAEETKKLAEDMKNTESKKPMAGQPSVSKASKSAGAAGKKLSSGKCGGANSDQKKTIEELKKAMSQLDEEIEELERLSKMEKLASIEEQLEKVLTDQKECTQKTQRVYTLRAKTKPHYNRQATQTILEVSKQENSLSKDVGAIRRLLVKEGTTVVFPEVLDDIVKDMQSVSKRLEATDPGKLTQAMQKDIEETIQELLDAVRKELSKGPGRKKGGGACKGGGKSPLVPPLAELRMLRLKMKRVNRGTKRLEKMKTSKMITEPEAKIQHAKLAERHKKVLELAGKIKSKLDSSQPKLKNQE
ncbi:MAG: DUF4175 family protein [Phycisphaerae bacterium]|nr:DUF4175 family protein [Phycisphaerae bacterium]